MRGAKSLVGWGKLLRSVVTAAIALFIMPFAAAASPAQITPVPCPELPPIDTSDWKQIVRAFRHAPVWKFDQFWRSERERGFRGGEVRFGWRNDRLLYFVDLNDREVTTQANKRNDRLWTLGDVLEVFAGVQGSPAYIEYHTAPNGLTLQFFWPNPGALKKTKGPKGPKPFMKNDDAAVAITRRTRSGWQVYGEVPAASIWARKLQKAALDGQVWDLSFSRYDYPTGDGAPILSSTSPLTQAAYHRRHEWRQVRFVR